MERNQRWWQQMGWLKTLTGKIWLLGALFGTVLFIFLALRLIDTSHQTTNAGRSYEAYSAAFALFAGWAAVMAILFALPSFAGWIRSVLAVPKMTLSARVATGVAQVPEEVPGISDGADTSISLATRKFYLKAIIENIGTATLTDGVLNIVVPAECGLEALDAAPKQHFVAAMPSSSSDLFFENSGSTPARLSIAYDEYRPDTVYAFHVAIEPPRPGVWRVMIEISGDPQPPRHERFLWLAISTL